MSGILGFATDQPQMIDIDKLHRALRSLEQRGRSDHSILLLNRINGSSLFHVAELERKWSPVTLTGCTNRMADAMLSGRHLFHENRSSALRNSSGIPDSGVVFVLDGVIDNFAELRGELLRLGQSVPSDMPLAILRAAFEEWGPACLARIDGSVALAVLDIQRGKLILARDAFGTRPLYYSRPNDREIVFGSQIAAVLELTSGVRRVNRASLYGYLVHNTMDHAPETFFEGICQIPPGHYLEVSLHKPSEYSVTNYRAVVQTETKLTFNEAALSLRELVVRSVASQIDAQKVIGAAHSGGYDSSFVIAAFERAYPDEQLQLYTCVPLVKDGEFSQSEEAWADLAASGFRSPVHKVFVSAKDLPQQLDSVVSLQEEPFSSPVVLAQWQLFRAAQDHGVGMMLSGQGGDTMFASTSRQVLHAIYAHLRQRSWRSAAAVLKAASRLPNGRIGQLARAAAQSVLPPGLHPFARRFIRRPAPDWLKMGWFEFDVEPSINGHGLPMLRFEDRNSTACGILNRMPLLVRGVQDFVQSLPPELFVRAEQPLKSIEWAALQGLVPDAIRARKQRSGFPVPVREWLCELAPWVDTVMREVSSLPFLESSQALRIWETVRSRNGSREVGFLIWRWVLLCGWLRNLNVHLD
jgi:asparagine synthase (glutamine-hydrolysing)